MKYRVAEAAPRTAMRHRAVYRRGPAAACQEPPCIHHRHTNAAVGAAAVDTPPPSTPAAAPSKGVGMGLRPGAQQSATAASPAAAPTAEDAAAGGGATRNAGTSAARVPLRIARCAVCVARHADMLLCGTRDAALPVGAVPARVPGTPNP